MKKSRLVLQASSMFLLYNVILFYIGWNGYVWLNTIGFSVSIWPYSIVIGLCGYGYLLGKIHPFLTVFKVIGAYWFGVLQYALLLLPLADLIVWVIHISGVTLEHAICWTGWSVVLVLLSLFSYGMYNAYSPVVRSYSFSVPKQAGKRESLRIAVASDMHFGTLSGVNHVKRLVKKVQSLSPDLVLFPGDIVDDDPQPFIRKKMGDILGQVHAPLGVYGVLGNHEYYGKQIPQFIDEMNRIGVSILMDETQLIDNSFYLIGRKDKTDKNRDSFHALTQELNPSYPWIALDHQPDSVQEATDNGIDVMVSGHTHRGQMAPNHFITKKIFENDWGYLKKEQLHSIVSSGFGFWGPPLRIGSRSELVFLTITFLPATLKP